MFDRLDIERKKILFHIFPMKVIDSVRIRESKVIPWLGDLLIGKGIAAVTILSVINFRRGQYVKTIDGMALLAHEVTHVYQVHKDGIIKYFINYCIEWLKGRATFGDGLQAYSRLGYEKQAYMIGAAVRDWLTVDGWNPGTDIFKYAELYPYRGKRLNAERSYRE